uniref:hypothetical protein n=1 Tax=Ruminococcus sp. TaxID=41978 RepID=UPI0025CEB048
MKNYFDSFYELIHKNNVKRRRMVSLLLVLSVFVSTGVLWELRDTVITMVNEPICGIEEHEHSDECYERVLVCGLEENAEHIHTDDCYEKVLVCGHDEHLHTMLCYTDEELPDYIDQSENNEPEVVSIDLPSEETSEEQLLSQLSDENVPEIQLVDQVRGVLENEKDPRYPVPLTNTIDNIAKGIKFTLFDYGDNDLEAAQNNYGINYNSETGQWEHTNVKKVGINTGRDPSTDIMFFSYGTP